MKTRTMLSIGLSAFVLTGTAAGVASLGMSAFAASAENPKRAASEADAARKFMAKRKADKAVQHAEAAVAYDPRNPEYRALLGQAYLLAGRFASAKQALGDSLSLDPSNGRVALNYALAQIAQGDWAGARSTLDTNEATIAASDRGLAYALAGDPVKAVAILEPASRAADASAKTRQNFALSLALAGRWQEAKTVAAMDVSPDQLDARIMEWASFSRPTNAYDQVASLLGVRPIADSGQPAQLALVQVPNVGVAAVQPPAANPLDAYMPATPANAEDVASQVSAETGVDVQVAAADPAPVLQQVAGTGPQVVFGPREEVVQAVATPVRQAAPVRAPAPVRVASPVAKPAPVRVAYAKGNYFVQLGAYDNAGVARDAWRRTASRVPALGRHTPQGAKVSTKGGNFYRLSVGGFARADADSLCRSVRSTGGNCFVRVQAGDQLASWVRPNGTQVASR
ncbi:MAG: tetratricopeptide repeat protein [Pseudomonadota bacterium]